MNMWQNAGVIAAAALTVVLLLRLVVGYLRGRRIQMASRGFETSSSRKEQLDVTGDIPILMSQLDELAGRIDQRMQERTHRIEQLLIQTDEKIRQLQQLNEQTARVEQRPQAPPQQRYAPTPSAPIPPQSFEPTNRAPRPFSTAENKQIQILSLGAQGIDPVEIARRLALDVGEVELVFNLHRSAFDETASQGANG